MLFLLLLALCLAAVLRLRFTGFNADHLGFDQTTAVKGFFVGLVFLSHLYTYLDPALRSTADGFAVTVLLRIGQFSVAYFFFCSGYGILHSYKTKPQYGNGFLKHRVLKTLLRFDAAVLLYLVLSFVIPQETEPLDYILCWIGWRSLGNSNWFIFVSLALYIVTLTAFSLRKKTEMSESAMVAVVYGLSAVLWVFLSLTKSNYWYNTLFCFPLGMSVCLHKDRITAFAANGKSYAVSIAVTAVLCLITYRIHSEIIYSVSAMLFCLLLMLLSVKVEVNSPVLKWMGGHVFEVYLLHRFPMIVLQYCGVNNYYVFGAAAVCATVLMAVLFKALERKIGAVLGL